MHRFRATAIPGAILALLILAGSGRAASPVDLRGSWACVAAVGSTRYAQTVTITSEDAAGRFAGSDVGGGLTFTVSGTVTGSGFTMIITGGGYTSRARGSVSGTLPHLAFTGTFADSNHATGSFTGKMTAAAVPTVSPAPAVSAGPVETPAPADVATDAPVAADAAIGPVATIDVGAAGPITPPETPPGDSNPLPLPLEIALAAAVIAGLGAAALGLVPGVPGIAGSSGAVSDAQASRQAAQARQDAQTVVGTNLQNAVGDAVQASRQAAQDAQAAQAGQPAAINPTPGETPAP